MGRTLRSLLALIGILLLLLVIFSGLLFALAGDDIIDFARSIPSQVNVLVNRDVVDSAVGDDPSPVRFFIESGQTPVSIAENLASQSLISDSALFVDVLRAENLDAEVEAGIYFLNQTQTMREIAFALTDSRTSQISLTIFPGWRIEQVAEAISVNPLFGFSGDDFLAVVGRGAQIPPTFAAFVSLPSGSSLEGFMSPDTYSLPPNITAVGLRDILLESFTLAMSTQLVADAQAQGLTLYEVVTLASIVQREAIHPDEHDLIAGVYLNRLNIDMRLDADPTVQYPLGSAENWWPRITVADYQATISSYNTYRNIGLPPGPISSPGLSAINAVVYPEESGFFFFRADCRTDGYHDFAVTYEEHLANGC